jgi:hypothetical protein
MSAKLELPCGCERARLAPSPTRSVGMAGQHGRRGLARLTRSHIGAAPDTALYAFREAGSQRRASVIHLRDVAGEPTSGAPRGGRAALRRRRPRGRGRPATPSHLGEERPRCQSRQRPAFASQMRLVSVAGGRGQACDRGSHVCLLERVAQREEVLKAADALQGLRAVPDRGHEVPAELARRHEERRRHVRHAPARPRLEAPHSLDDDGIGRRCARPCPPPFRKRIYPERRACQASALRWRSVTYGSLPAR